MISFAYRAQLRQSMQGEFVEEAKKHVRMLLDFLKAEHHEAPFCIFFFTLTYSLPELRDPARWLEW